MSTKITKLKEKLHRSWIDIALIYSLSLSMGYIILRKMWISTFAERWLVSSMLISLYLLGFVHYNLDKSRPLAQLRSLQGLGLPNLISLTRGLFLISLAGFIFLPRPRVLSGWVPGLLYGCSLIGDYIDGYAARYLNSETVLGAKLDQELDSLGVLIASLAAYSYGMIPIWVAVTVGSARYIFILGKWVRRKMGESVHELDPKFSRLLIANIQRSFLFLVLLPIFSSPLTRSIASILMILFIGGFVRDWLIVIGIIENDD